MHMIFVDTEDYSGNFERELVAFATGCADEGGRNHTHTAAQMARKDMAHSAWWKDNILPHVGDEDEYPACYANIAPTPGWYNDGMGGHFRNEEEHEGRRYPAYQSVSIAVRSPPPEEVWEEFQQRLIEFCERACLDIFPEYMARKTAITLSGVRQEAEPRKIYGM